MITRLLAVTGIGLFALIGTGCNDNDDANGNPFESLIAVAQHRDQVDRTLLGSVPEAAVLRDEKAIFAIEETRRVPRAVLTTFDGDYSFAEVNADLDPHDAQEPFVAARLNLEDYADDGKPRNARVRLQGDSVRMSPQKSYRIDLDPGVAPWRGAHVLELGKNPFDLTRVRHKLAFDLYGDIPHVPRLRTQLLELYVANKDRNGVEYAAAPYGLFTQVEKPDADFLAVRGLPADGNIYLAHDFTFHPEPDLALDASGAILDRARFSRILEPVVDNGDHRKLQEMLAALNDPAADFNQVFNRYFDRYNYLAWLASNVLIGNRDTISMNFALYQPAGSDKFYFLPTDYADAFGLEGQPDQKQAKRLYGPWQSSASNWWDVPLHKRFLQDAGHLASLKRVVNELYAGYLSPAHIRARLNQYRDQIRPFLAASPDHDNLPAISANKLQEWSAEYTRLPTTVTLNRAAFFQGLERPMPFWLGVELANGRLLLTWDQAQDLQRDKVGYTVQLSTTPTFQTLALNRQTDFLPGGLAIDRPANGVYYLRVVARDAKGNQQVAFDRYDATSGQAYFGVLAFRLDDSGAHEIRTKPL